MKIKRFEELNEQQVSSDEFEELKQKTIQKLDEFFDLYDEFTIYVSSQNWRVSGSHYQDLIRLKKDIVNYKQGDDNDFKWAIKDNPKWSHLANDYDFLDTGDKPKIDDDYDIINYFQPNI